MGRLGSLRSRLMAVYLGLIVLGFGGLTLVAGRLVTTSIFDDYVNTLRIYALSSASQLASSLEYDRAGAERLVQNPAIEQAQMAVFDGRGDLFMSTDGETAVLVTNSSNFVRQKNAVGVDTFYVAADIMSDDGRIGTVQIAVPATEPQAAVRQRWLALAGGFVGFSVVGLVVTLWLVATLTRPLSHLQDTALKLADGDLGQRVPQPGQDEIGSVGSAFNTMADRIEAMIQEQRAFTSNASHELRTPLTTIQLRTEWLKSGELDEATARQYIEEVDSEVQRLASLVNDLLLLSQLEGRGLKVGEGQVDVGRLARSVVAALAGQTEAKGVTVQLDVADSVTAVQANINHLRVVIRNLLDNALKYTLDDGAVICTVTQSDGFVLLMVRDNGVGIAPEELPHIMKRFYRVDKSHSRQVEGVGLGLALVQSVVALYGGTFVIESEGVGMGTAVTVRWPIRQL